jgi:hypothetical protein
MSATVPALRVALKVISRKDVTGFHDAVSDVLADTTSKEDGGPRNNGSCRVTVSAGRMSLLYTKRNRMEVTSWARLSAESEPKCSVELVKTPTAGVFKMGCPTLGPNAAFDLMSSDV